MRYVPEIHFVYDTSLDYGNRIDAILREIGPDGEADA
jgi:ribosome-binding factor A